MRGGWRRGDAAAKGVGQRLQQFRRHDGKCPVEAFIALVGGQFLIADCGFQAQGHEDNLVTELAAGFSHVTKLAAAIGTPGRHRLDKDGFARKISQGERFAGGGIDEGNGLPSGEGGICIWMRYTSIRVGRRPSKTSTTINPDYRSCSPDRRCSTC